MSYTRFFQLFSRAQRVGVVKSKDHHDLLHDYCGKSSLKDLSAEELAQLEVHIQELMDPVAAAANRMRRKVIAILAARGAVTAQNKPDMDHIYAWVLKYGYLHKPFNHYTYAELTRLVTQAEKVVSTDLKALRNNG